MKTKKSLLTLLLASGFVLASCSGDGTTSTSIPLPPLLEIDIPVKIDSSLASESKTYEFSFRYEDSYFLDSANTFSPKLAMLSYGAAMANGTHQRGDSFYGDAEFDDVTKFGYESEPTTTSLGYYIAHKNIQGVELLTASFKGLDYGAEWANNFLIGKEGDHEGFYARANEVYLALQKYIVAYCGGHVDKIWLTGYSRGGAIANLLSSLILRDDKIEIKGEDMFTYTFEAPACVAEDKALEYANVHNIVNKNDFITHIPPLKYGLKRCGVDHEIYASNYATLMKQFDEQIDVPEFKEIVVGEELNGVDDASIVQYLLDCVFNRENPDADKSANTREDYYNNYQKGISEGIGYVFALKPLTRKSMLAWLQAEENRSALLGIISDATGQELLNFFEPYLIQDEISYDRDNLLEDCAVIVKAIGSLFIKPLMLYAMYEQFGDDLTRLIDMHYPESVYVLMANSFEN